LCPVIMSIYSTTYTFFFLAEDGIRDRNVTGVQTCALPIFKEHHANNVYTMLVSGAFTNLLTHFTTEFPFDKVIGTDIPILNNEVNKTEQIEHIQGTMKNEKINDAL